MIQFALPHLGRHERRVLNNNQAHGQHPRLGDEQCTEREKRADLVRANELWVVAGKHAVEQWVGLTGGGNGDDFYS